jgi:hypothetical protein
MPGHVVCPGRLDTDLYFYHYCQKVGKRIVDIVKTLVRYCPSLVALNPDSGIIVIRFQKERSCNVYLSSFLPPQHSSEAEM